MSKKKLFMCSYIFVSYLNYVSCFTITKDFFMYTEKNLWVNLTNFWFKLTINTLPIIPY